ncbi:nickel-dependent hydrogenase large subunit [Candidatus Borrarchaeum sp.]|uniref:nickel-dependent hydrogenase large subunit n=1 Tax=Candidatus Borrarchaeum sp. TaxID=2846742 RepID=UPI00257A9495|nr:nickel-dependent hydrogenase large subunit [Candidatus Borrarchaeum sp.]
MNKTKKMTIKPLTRIEGHGQIEIFVNKDKDEVSRVNFSTLDYRGIEKILIGKKISEIPRLVSKICGFCSAAHIVASCKAFEKALDIEPTYASALSRQLVLIGETITNHMIHFVYMALPDLLSLASASQENDVILNRSELFVKAAKLISIGKNVTEIVGGRAVQPVSIIIGGMSKNLTEKEINLLKRSLKSGIAIAKFFLNFAQEIIEKIDDTVKMFELKNPLYMGLQRDGTYSIYDGRLKIANEDRETLATFDVNDYDKFIIDNRIKTSSLTSSSTQERGRGLLVGPLARYHITNEYGVYEVHEILKDFQKWDENILMMNVLRLIEILVCLYKGLLILDNTEITKEQPVFVTSTKLKYDNIFSAVEAPRGTLIHYYKVNENMTANDVKIHVPTELNTFSIHEILNRICQKEFTKNKSLETVQETAKFIVRSFDPCISCSSVSLQKAHHV